jgi:AmmeMemoRadiSam system protein B
VTAATIRRPAAAGTFYPGRTHVLARTVDDLLDLATVPEGIARLRAIVVPHAGYVYSGPVAASAYVLLRGMAARVRRIAIFGPAHFVPLRGTAVPEAEAWSTPLGEVPVDPELRLLCSRGGATIDDRPHEPEHSIEVQLPFLQRIVGPELGVLPVAVGVTSPADVADLIAEIPDHVPVVVSTDLSHYHDDASARRLDRRTAEAVVALDPSAIGPEDACGVFALRGLVEHARRTGLEIRLLDLRTSADTAGDPSSVVGYGAFVVGAQA